MSFNIPYSQIFGLSPNNPTACSATISGQQRATLLAFPCDHVIFIFDRATFGQKYIETPDPTSEVTTLSFSGTSFIYCVNSKGILYKFQINDLNNLGPPIDSLDIGCVPNSIASSIDTLFIQDKNTLYSYSVSKSLESQKPYILSRTYAHQKCRVSPCGRALASFSSNGPPPVIWFKPFENQNRFVLPVNTRITDFQWGVHDHLIAATSDLYGNVRIWVESTDSLTLRNTAFICLNTPLLDISICVNTDPWHQPGSPVPASSLNLSVFPEIRRDNALIIVGSKDHVFIIQEKNEAQLECMSSFEVTNESSFSVSDFYSFYLEHEVKRCVTTTRFGKHSLTFYQIEIGKSGISYSIPFSVPFLPSPVKNIQWRGTDLYTELRDGSFFNWTLNKFVEQDHHILHVLKHGDKNIITTKDSITYSDGTIFHFSSYLSDPNLTVKYASASLEGSEIMHVLIHNKGVFVVFYDGNSTKTVDVELNESSYESAAIHSTDLIAICSQSKVTALLFSGNIYRPFASFSCENPSALFIPHPLALIAVSSHSWLRFFIICHKRFVPVDVANQHSFSLLPSPSLDQLSIDNFKKIASSNELKDLYITDEDNLIQNAQCLSTIQSTPICSIKRLENDAILIATEHTLFRMHIQKEMLLQPFNPNHLYLFYTALSLGLFRVVQQRLEHKHIDFETFRGPHDPEAFTFSSPSAFHPLFDTISKHIPQHWNSIDLPGIRFLISYLLCIYSLPDNNINDDKNHVSVSLQVMIPFFGLWALKSKDQRSLSNLLNFNTLNRFLQSMIPLWVSSTSVLKDITSNLITKINPQNDEIDLYLLICVALGKRNLAAKIAATHSKEKLAVTLSKPENILSHPEFQRRLEKSAYASLTTHLYELSALFFILRGMPYQAVLSIKGNPLLSLFLSRLLGLNNWTDFILPIAISNNKSPNYDTSAMNFIIEFYHLWWTNKHNEALESFSKIELPISDTISLEAHRYMLLQDYGHEHRELILNLQLCPHLASMFAKGISFYSSGKATGPSDSSDELDDINPPSEEEELANATNKLMTFDFGGTDGWDGFDDEFSSSDEENKDSQPLTEALKIIEETAPKEPVYSDEIQKLIVGDGNLMGIENAHLFTSTLGDSFEQKPFESIQNRNVTLRSQEYTCKLMARLFNHNGSSKTIPFLLEIAQWLLTTPNGKLVATAIVYSICLHVECTKWLAPLLLGTLDDYNFTVICEQLKDLKSMKHPDLLSNFASCPITENDKQLTLFVCLDQLGRQLFARNLEKPLKNGDDGSFQNVVAFLHHRHRLMMKSLSSFHFSDPCLARDMSTFNIDCSSLEKLHHAKVLGEWAASLQDRLISPFFIDNAFRPNCMYFVKLPISTNTPVLSLAIDPLVNQRITFARGPISLSNQNFTQGFMPNEKNVVFITQENLDGLINKNDLKSDGEWDVVVDGENPQKKEDPIECPSVESTDIFFSEAPFVSAMNPAVHYVDLSQDFDVHQNSSQKSTLKLSSYWKEKKTPVSFRCVSSHPSESKYIAGDSQGCIHLCDFQNVSNSQHWSIKYTDDPIYQLSYNSRGDRFVCTTREGSVIISDFDSADSFNTDPYAAVEWVNSDCQLAVCDHLHGYIFDFLVGIQPVATFSFSNDDSYDRGIAPIAVFGPQIVIGSERGEIKVFDIRMMKQIWNLPIHNGPVNAIKYDPSGLFFVSGSEDNSVCIVDRMLLRIDTKENIFTDVPRKGVFSLATSNQAVVAGGYSNVIKVWTVTEPNI